MSTIKHWLTTATDRLAAANVDSPRLSAELILAHVSGLDRVRLRAWPETPLSPEWLDGLHTLLMRREAGEPVAYLIGRREFFGRDFLVSPDTLIPRPETELLVEAALNAFPAESRIHFADFGTGSGCIAVTLCAERPNWHGVAVDASHGALAIAARNAQVSGVSGLRFVCADFSRPLLPAASLDLMVSNPPYVSDAEYTDLSKEVRAFEPVSALVPRVGLDSGTQSDGLELARAVIEAAGHALRPGGVLLMEHGYTQGHAVRVLLENNTWKDAANCADLAGLDRYVRAVRSA